MRINLNYDESGKGTAGKSKFLNRLAVQLSCEGHRVTNAPFEKVDVALHSVKVKSVKASVNVLRLDGVYFDTKLDYRKKNQSIRQSFRLADGIVYQSQWAKAMCDRYLGKFDGPTAIILNGADPCFYQLYTKSITTCNYLFFAAARWRSFKRLKDIIESFVLAEIPDSELYVAGDLKKSDVRAEDYKQHRNIKFCGVLNNDKLAYYLKNCTAFLHLSRFDACPNGVVEAVAAKAHTICGNISGTREIVEPSGGTICDIEQPYDMKPIDVYNIPKIDRQKVVCAMWYSIQTSKEINNSHVDIVNISHQYSNFFLQLLMDK